MLLYRTACLDVVNELSRSKLHFIQEANIQGEDCVFKQTRMRAITSRGVISSLVRRQNFAPISVPVRGAISGTDPSKGAYTARMEKTGRPISPHVTIYAFPMAAISSITNRVTGVALYGGEKTIRQIDFWMRISDCSNVPRARWFSCRSISRSGRTSNDELYWIICSRPCC